MLTTVIMFGTRARKDTHSPKMWLLTFFVKHLACSVKLKAAKNCTLKKAKIYINEYWRKDFPISIVTQFLNQQLILFLYMFCLQTSSSVSIYVTLLSLQLVIEKTICYKNKHFAEFIVLKQINLKHLPTRTLNHKTWIDTGRMQDNVHLYALWEIHIFIFKPVPTLPHCETSQRIEER